MCFSEKKKAPGRAAPHRSQSWGAIDAWASAANVNLQASPGRGQFGKRIYMIAEDEIGIVERLGEFSHLAYPGVLILFAPLCYPVEALRKRMDSRVNQLNIQTDVKSKDNVFVKLGISIMFHLVKEQAYDACYTM